MWVGRRVYFALSLFSPHSLFLKTNFIVRYALAANGVILLRMQPRALNTLLGERWSHMAQHCLLVR